MFSSYASSGQLDTYASEREITLASGDKGKALVRAAAALDSAYEARYPGTKADYTQFLSWPRTGAAWPDGTAISGTPDQLVWANCELAIAELASPNVLSIVVTPGKLKKRARVEGAVEVEYWRDVTSYDPAMGQMPIYSVVEGYLRQLVGSRRALPGVLVV